MLIHFFYFFIFGFSFDLFQDRFDPIIDSATQLDLIPAMAYGYAIVFLPFLSFYSWLFLSSLVIGSFASSTDGGPCLLIVFHRRSHKGQDYHGMYCAILTAK